MRLSMFLGAALLAATPLLHAQAPKDDADKAKSRPAFSHRMDCSKAQDPKACEERRAKMKGAHENAKKACEAQKGEGHRECMQREMCAQAKDPKACEAQVAKRKANRERIRDACKGKQGEELKTCVREQRGKK
jgi:Spy/CpxP family protein refolding chaperone